jgi:glycerate 2-kinase
MHPTNRTMKQIDKKYLLQIPSSLQKSRHKEAVLSILHAALQAVDPVQAVTRHIRLDASQNLLVQDRSYQLDRYRRVLVVGAGKAGAPMTEAVVNLLEDRLERAIVVVKEGYANINLPHRLSNRVSLIEAGHPIPDMRGQEGAQQILELLKSTTEEDLVICLISGGGSAIISSPIRPMNISDIQEMTSLLLHCGASIEEINTLRKHTEQLKGGQLARLASPAQVISLILSDVVGNPLEVIASGPTVPDSSTYEQALAIIDNYQLRQEMPDRIINHLEKGKRKEVIDTPKPGDPIFNRVQNVITGSNYLAAQASLDEAKKHKFNTQLLTTYLQGEARQAGRFMAAIVRQIADSQQPIQRPACLICGGETTVTIQGVGTGGRNMEMALGTVMDLHDISNIMFITLATDGGDGPTDAAGAIVTGETLQRSQQLGMNPLEYLNNNDSYTYFNTLGDIIKTGPTQTNVNDLSFIFAF